MTRTELPPLPEPMGAMDVDLGPAGPEYMDGAAVSAWPAGLLSYQFTRARRQRKPHD